MKIIKPGMLEGTRSIYKYVCDKCGCEFEYEMTDLECTSSKYPASSGTKYFLRCPCCSRKFEIHSYDMKAARIDKIIRKYDPESGTWIEEIENTEFED